MTPDELEAREATLTLINAEISARLDRQFESLGRIESKAGLLLGYTIAAASFLSTRNFQPVLAGFAYGLFGLAAITGVGALALRKYQDIEPVSLISYADSSQSATLAALIARRARIYGWNVGRQRSKTRAWWACLFAVVLGSVLMVTSILVQTGSHDAAKQRRQRAAAVHASEPATGRSATAAPRVGPH